MSDAVIIGIGCLMPEVTKQASVSGAKTELYNQEWLVCWDIMRHLDTFVWEYWHLHLVFV